jgi:hypothetical protein
MRPTLALLAVAALLAAPAAHAAPPSPADLSVTVTNAIFKGRWSTVWKLLHPKYRAITTFRKWSGCHAAEAAAMGRLKIEQVEAATTKVGTASFPGIGKIPVAVVTVHVHYVVPGNPLTQVGTNTAYWTSLNGKWVGLLSPPSYAALKAGRCP